MKNKLLLLTFGILLISLTSATNYNIYSGDSISFDLNQTYDYYSIINNLTEINLSVIQEGTIVTITTDKYSLSDSFDLIFFNKEKEIITVYQSGGGGGGGTRTITKEVIKEVPTYLTEWKTNETIKVVENKTIEEKIINTDKIPIFGWILIVLCGITIFGLLWYFFLFPSKSKENIESEGGLEENE